MQGNYKEEDWRIWDILAKYGIIHTCYIKKKACVLLNISAEKWFYKLANNNKFENKIKTLVNGE